MKLYGFPHSPFVHKVEVLLDLLGLAFVRVDVPYGDRSELVAVTGGYVQVPVLVEDDGTVVCDSRRIAERLLARGGAALVPSPWEGPIWSYHDWVDGVLEDVLFRLVAPAMREAMKTPSDRALWVLMKERRYGTGCVEEWSRSRDALLAKGRALLAPTARTLAARPFLFGDAPTLADAALAGQLAMLSVGSPGTELEFAL